MIFFWDRPVPASWSEELTRLSPKRERVSHLVLFWESGTPAEPSQRYVIYEATPLAYIPEWKLRSFWEGCGPQESPGRQRIRKYLEATECLATPFWIIQGQDGGHLRRYTQVDVNWAKLAGRPGEPPDVGALPYAPFDQRVIRKLRAYDRTRWAFANLVNAEQHEQREAEIAFRSALSQYVDDAVESAFDDLPLTRKAGLVDALPHAPTMDRRSVDLEGATDAFIQGREF